jgi:hypothetical protein
VLNYWPANLHVTVTEGDADPEAVAAARSPRCADEPSSAVAPAREAGERRTLRAIVIQPRPRPFRRGSARADGDGSEGDGGGDGDGHRLPAVAIDVRAGELLYLPFGWWHQVYSQPDCGADGGGLCASVSHSYTPFFCRLGGRATARLGPIGVNPAYRVLANACAQGEFVRRSATAGTDVSSSGSASDDDDSEDTEAADI